MAIETDKFNLLYGKILSIIKDIDKSKAFTKILYDICEQTGISHNEILKYVSESGLRFENKIYEKLNQQRTNSSQLGFIDKDNIPPRLASQINL